MAHAYQQQAGGASRVAGLSVAAALTLAAGYALTSGLARDVAAFILPATEMSVLPPPAVEQPQPVELAEPFAIALGRPAPTLPEIPVFVSDAVARIVVDPAPREPVATGSTYIRPAPTIAEPRRGAPKLTPGAPPAYPPASIRGGEEGATTLEVCVAANGRVSSATIAQSSGHVRLDDAALKWVRASRFAPGTIDGAAQAMCGHHVVYDWRLEAVRR